MKQALTFTPPILSSTESKLNVEAFDASVEAFENHEYLKSFYALLDYINGDFRTKYGNVQGNEFHIPHGSIIVNIKLDEEKLSITAPFVALPEKGRIPLLRQVAGLNFNAMDLATLTKSIISCRKYAVRETNTTMNSRLNSGHNVSMSLKRPLTIQQAWRIYTKPCKSVAKSAWMP